MFVPLTVASAAVNGGYTIDGVIPGADGTFNFPDPSGNTDELGPKNGSPQQLGVINVAPKPMLALTNPNGKEDLTNVWFDTKIDGDTGDMWLYFAWEREGNSGSGQILYEFQQAPKPAACDYNATDATLIANCNPWENRQSGDFIIEFNQLSSGIEISRRNFTGVGSALTLGAPVVLNGASAAGAVSDDEKRGEAALNLSATIFAGAADSCVSLPNLIPMTITGGSPLTADIKDTILEDTSALGISSCGSVEITKETTPAGENGSFPVTLTRAGGGDVVYPSGTSAGTTLTGDGDVATIDDLRGATDYTLAETVPSGWELLSVFCDGVDVTAPAATFSVVAGETTECTVTNKKNVPALTIEKTASPTSFSTVGASIGYRYEVENTGNVDLDGPVTVTDDKIPGTITCPAGSLAVGATTTCTATYTTTQTDLDDGEVVNTAGAHAFYDGDAVDSPTDEATVIARQAPALSLDKTSPTLNYDAVGDVVSYSYLVKNTGNVTLAGPVTVADDKATVTCPTGGLAPQATMTCSATHTITQAELDVGSLTNIAQASANGTDSNEDSATVDAVQSRTITLDKSSPTVSYDAVGDTLSYSYLVTNTGNVTLAGPATVSDNKATVTCPGGSLAPGGSKTCTATYTVTQADLDDGSVTNLATATVNTIVSNQDSVTIDAVQSPALTIEKTPSPTTYDAVGDVIAYSFLVTNSGNVTLDGPVTIDDNRTFDEACPDVVTLAPGASVTCTASHTITQANLDAGSVTNTATASATFDGDEVTSPPDGAIVNAVQEPALGLDKTSVPTSAYSAVGQSISYAYKVTNTGNVTLSGPFTVADDKTGTTCPPTPSLAPQAFITCTASYTITQADLDAGSLTNTATASGGGVTSGPDSVTLNAIQTPALSVTKTPTPTTYASVGQVIDYLYTVSNSGNVTLAGPFTVGDDKTSTTCASNATLAPGSSLTCTGDYVITQLDLDAGSVTNTATAYGFFEQDQVSSEQVKATVDAVPAPALTLVKTASPTTYDAVGDTIGYSYRVTNSGNVTLSGPFTVMDDKATATCPGTGSLAPGASITCTASHVVTQQELDDGSITNLATAKNSAVTSNQDSEVVTAVQNKALTILKSASPTTYSANGQTIGYSYTVTNSGNVTLSGPFSVVDDKTSNTNCPATATLAPGAFITCTASYSTSQADVDSGSVTNIAYATGGGATSGTDSETVAAVQRPALAIVKTPSPTTYSAVGQAIGYSYLVTNSGNVTLSGPFTVVDDKATVTCPGTASLAPTASLTCAASATITQAHLDAGSLTNTARAFGSFGESTVSSEPDDATVDAVRLPALTIAKSASPSTYSAVGQTVSYSYLVTNSGNVTLSGPFTVADDKATASCPATASLAPGESLTCTASYVVTQADLNSGSVTNTATASGGGVTSPPDSETVDAVQSPALTIEKTPSPLTYSSVGQEVDYSYLVTNSGNVTLSGPFTVSDDKATASCPSTASLAPGGTITCTATYVVTQADLNSGSVTNTATASGGGVTSPPDTARVEAVRATGLTLVKTAGTPTYSTVGQVVSYTYAVTNSGNVTLPGPFTVTDDKTTVTCPALSSLDPAGTTTCTAQYTVTQADLDGGSVTNLATASNGTVTSNPDSETVTAVQTRGLTVTKAASPTTYDSVGDVITYTYVMTNTGTVTLAGPFTVTDDKTSTTCPTTTSLAPGATLTCTATYVITQADLDTGDVVNVARASNGTTTSPPVQARVDEVEVAVLPTVLTQPPVATPTATAPPAAQPRVLPFTGSWLLPLLAFGSAAVLLGALLVGGVRRRA